MVQTYDKNMPNSYRDMRATFRNILKNCKPITVRNFTESEAEEYVKNCDCNLTFSEIEDISGTNPYLLSHVHFAKHKVDYKWKVNDLVEEFVHVDLEGLKADPTSLGDYLLNNNVLKCWKFVYCACRGEILNEDEVEKYELRYMVASPFPYCAGRSSRS